MPSHCLAFVCEVKMKTVIWDFNGTILDDTALCFEIENEMLVNRGKRVVNTLETRRNAFCFPVITYYRYLGYTFEDETFAQVAEEFNQLYASRYQNCSLMDGFLEMIETSHAKGYRNVILSASKQEILLKQCKEFGINHYFDEILGLSDGLAASKVDMAKHWMERANIDPKDCMYIGDTDHDALTAKAIGVDEYYLVACGHQSYEVLKRTGAKHVVKQLKEVDL